MTTQQDDGRPGTDVAPTAAPEGLPERFENPGLPPHHHRVTDIDPRAAKRAERQVAAMFGLSVLGTVLVLVAYFAVKFPANSPANMVSYLKQVGLSTLLLGLGLFLALFGIGVGAVHWAKTLMPDDERSRGAPPAARLRGGPRCRRGHPQEGADESGLRAQAADPQHPDRRRSACAGISPVVFLRDLGPMPAKNLDTSFWKRACAWSATPREAPSRRPT